MSLVGSIAQRIAWLRRSSTLRLALLLSIIFAIGMATAIFVALTLGQDALERRLDATLEALAATSAGAEDSDTPSMVMHDPEDLKGLPRPFARVAERGGGTVQLNDDFRGSDAWRVLVSRDSDGAPVLVAIPIEDSEEALELLTGILWTTALLVIAATLAIGLGAGIVAQRRLARIDTTLHRLAAGELTARTGHDRSRDDLDDIARQLDRTAESLERLVTQTRHLSASLAHDLRTPLARLRARLEMLPEGEERGAALEDASRLSDIFDTIMRVARIEAAQGKDGFEDVALTELLDDLSEIFGPVVEDEGKTLKLELSDPATVAADRQMLIQAMANLIQNGLVHGGSEITLFATGREVGVADNGSGVDPQQFAEITKPMVRLDAARASEGTGLGLALVRAVAERHGAKLLLSEQKPTGLRVAMKFAEL